MCSRFRLTAKQAEVAERFGLDPALIMPEPERLPPLKFFPSAWPKWSGGGAAIASSMS